MTTAPNISDLVHQWIESFNAHDPADVASLYSEDAVVADPAYQEPLRGREAIEQDMRDFFGAFPDISAETKRTHVDGQIVVVEMRMTGTHTGPLQLPTGALEATNRAVQADACVVTELDDSGSIVNQWRYYDQLGLMVQVGALPQ